MLVLRSASTLCRTLTQSTTTLRLLQHYNVRTRNFQLYASTRLYGCSRCRWVVKAESTFEFSYKYLWYSVFSLDLKKNLPLLTQFVVLFLVGLKFSSSQTTSMAAVTPVVVAATAKQTATVSRRHNYCYPIYSEICLALCFWKHMLVFTMLS